MCKPDTDIFMLISFLFYVYVMQSPTSRYFASISCGSGATIFWFLLQAQHHALVHFLDQLFLVMISADSCKSVGTFFFAFR